MNVTFYLRQNKIWVNVSHNSERVRLTTNINIPPEFWANGKVKKAFKEANTWNNALTRLKLKIEKAIMLNEKDSLFNVVKDAISPQKQKMTLFKYFDIYIENKLKEGKTKRAINQMLMVHKDYKTFCKTDKKKYDFHDFNLELCERFIQYLKDLNLAQNTIEKRFSNLKKVIADAYTKDYHTNDVMRFQNAKLGVSKVDTDSIYLTASDLQKFQEVQLSNRLDKVRDVFLIACYTGLRFSDFSILTASNIIEGESKERRKYKAFQLKTQKTGVQVEIPLSKEVLTILEKHGGVPPKALSNQKMNDYLKEIGQIIGLNNTVEKTEIKGNTKKTNVFQKWELITCHTARRTFATNAILSGMPTYLVMSLTGHKTESSFKKYVKFSTLDASRVAADELFFK